MHRIEKNDKQQGLTMAWHGLTEIKPDLSIENNWLNDWDIKPTPLVAVTGGTEGVDWLRDENVRPTQFSLLTATDDPSITIGVPFNPNSYRPITNKEFVQLLKDTTEGIQNVKLMSVGSLRNRARVFASFETEELGKYTAGGREFKPYINFGNGHDKSSVLWANTSNTATVCDNTFSVNLATVENKVGDSLRQRHTKNVVARLPEMGNLLRMAVQLQQDFAVAFEKLAETPVKGAEAEALFTGFVAINAEEKISTRAKNIVARLMYLFRKGKGNKGQNLADLFSAVTDYYTHENAGNGKNPQKQFDSAMFGSGAQAKAEFFKIVTDQARLLKLREDGMAKLLLK